MYVFPKLVENATGLGDDSGIPLKVGLIISFAIELFDCVVEYHWEYSKRDFTSRVTFSIAVVVAISQSPVVGITGKCG
jgi:hypothetical protein